MHPFIRFSVFLQSALLLMAIVLPAAGQGGRNAKLQNLPDRTWLYVCPYNGASEFLGGSSEVPWTYDMNSKLFVRVGGCTGGYTNAIVLFDLGTETSIAPWGGLDRSATNRPGGGCQRGLCYNPIDRLIYEFGGGASPAGWAGLYGFWKGNMTSRTWTQYRTNSIAGGQVQVAADTANKVIVHTGRESSGYRHCYLYYPAGDSMIDAPVRPGSTELTSVINQDWWPTMQYAPGLGGTMYFAWMNGSGWFTWLFNARTRTWTDLHPTGLENSPSVSGYVSEGFRSVLSWDNANNVMLLHIPTFGIYVYNALANRWDKVSETNPQRTLRSQMFDYDDEHNVHVMASYNYSYDQDIWAFRYKNVTTKAETAVQGKGPRLDCSPNPISGTGAVQYRLDRASRVNLSVYDSRGRLVRVLDCGVRSMGGHEASWDASGAAPGCYLVRLQAGGRSVEKRVLIVK